MTRISLRSQIGDARGDPGAPILHMPAEMEAALRTLKTSMGRQRALDPQPTQR